MRVNIGLRSNIALLISLSLLTCTKPQLGDGVLYEGSIYGYDKDTDDFVTWFENVKLCMNITENVPMPQIKVYKDGSLMCGNFEQDGCQQDGTIILSEDQALREDVVKHAIVHYLLWATIGDNDKEHMSNYFKKCGEDE